MQCTRRQRTEGVGRCLAVVVAFFVIASVAEAQVSLNAFVDKTEVGDAETVAYTLELRGDLDGLGAVAAPKAEGLALAHPTPVLQSRVSVNGEDRLTLRWLYRPDGPGRASILATAVTVGGRTYRTDAIGITVVPQAQRGPPSTSQAPSLSPSPVRPPDRAEGELFVRAEPRTRRAVPGEQVVVDYVLYFEPHLRPRRSQVLGTWDAEGFWREELEVPPRDTYARSVTIGGQPYQAVTIRRLALFPTRTGRLDVGAMTFQVDLVRSTRRFDTRDPFGSFFNRFDEEETRADAVTIRVDPLPSGAPASFQGAVGAFDFGATLDRDTAAAGEPVYLTVQIAGTGNVATLAAPALDAPSGLDVLGPEEDRVVERSDVPLTGTKTFTYTLVPRGGGAFEVPEILWSYYDPEREAYRTRRAGPFDLRVSGPAAALALEAAPAPDTPRGLLADASWQRIGADSTLLPAGVLGALVGLPLLALLGLFAVRRRADRAADRSPEKRARGAHAVARRHLRAAHSGDGYERYATIEKAVRDFLSDRLGFPAHGLPRPDLLDALAASGVTDETRAALGALLDRCEAAQYAPVAVADDAKTAVEEATRLIATVDAEADEAGAR